MSTTRVSRASNRVPLTVRNMPYLLTIQWYRATTGTAFFRVTRRCLIMRQSRASVHRTFLFVEVVLTILFKARGHLSFQNRATVGPYSRVHLLLRVATIYRFPYGNRGVATLSNSRIIPSVLTSIRLGQNDPFLTMQNRVPTFVPTLSFQLISRSHRGIHCQSSSCFLCIRKR